MRTAAADVLKLAIIIPTLNEEQNVKQALQSVSGRGTVIVVDGGSTDATVPLAKAGGARVIKAARGRGPQQNAGWRAAKNAEWCLFLHADTQLPRNFEELLYQQLQQHDAHRPCWGCCQSIKLTQVAPWQSWLVEAGVALRTHLCRLPYGDQALFVRRKTLEAVQGFPDWRVLEDVDLVRRLNQVSPPLILPQPTTTSGRRYTRVGFLKNILLNQLIMFGWAARIPQVQLQQLYEKFSA